MKAIKPTVPESVWVDDKRGFPWLCQMSSICPVSEEALLLSLRASLSSIPSALGSSLCEHLGGAQVSLRTCLTFRASMRLSGPASWHLLWRCHSVF